MKFCVVQLQMQRYITCISILDRYVFLCLDALYFAVVVLACLQGVIPDEATTANWWVNLIANYVSFEDNG